MKIGNICIPFNHPDLMGSPTDIEGDRKGATSSTLPFDYLEKQIKSNIGYRQTKQH